jgi:isoquinoline 1-oxidoreductase subunit beta
MSAKRVKAPLTSEQRWKMTRRRFLIGTGSLGVLAVGGYFGINEGRPALVDAIEKSGASRVGKMPVPNLWFEMKPDNKMIFYAPKFEMGQGIHSALAQIAAEELEVDVKQLEVRQADSTIGFDPQLMFTFGSTSVNALFTPLREAAATMREMLRLEAAKQLSVGVNEVVALRGECFARQDMGKKLTYGQIVAGKQTEWEIPKTAPNLKARKAFTSIGQNTPRVDVRAKLLGQPVYGYDARVPDMLYGAVARPPRYGATLQSASAGEASNQPGVTKVVIDLKANFAGVVADTRTRARAALKFLTLEWQGGTNVNQNEIDAMVTARDGEGVVIRKRGNVDANVLTGTQVTAEYRTPFAAHAHLEPLSALAHVQALRVELWVPTQFTSGDTRGVQAAVGGEKREIVVYPMQMGGSFGRKGAQSAALEAVRLSNAVGKPVHVGWTREEDIQHGFFRPPSHTRFRGSLNSDGRINAIDQVTASGDILFSVIPIPEPIKNLIGFDFGVMSGQFSPYDFPNYRVRSHRVNLPVPTGSWRGLGIFPNTFALESFMDELAFAAKTDPLEFRLKHVPATEEGTRLKQVLEDVKTRSDWATPPESGRARGVAFSSLGKTFVAQVAEVSIVENRIVVHRVTISIDAGLVVNPANAALQAKGSVVMGLSSTLLEKLTIKDGMAEQANFKEYPLLTLKETPPRIDVNFLEGGDTPYGMGEPAIGPIGAAVANAVFALTQKRIRDLPLEL